MNYTILGCGRWGSFIAWYLDKNGHKVTSWGIASDPYVVDFFKTRKNSYVEFPESIELTNDLEYALNKNDNVIISISSQALRGLMQKVREIKDYDKKHYIICMKGIEETTGDRLSEVIAAAGVSGYGCPVPEPAFSLHRYVYHPPGLYRRLPGIASVRHGGQYHRPHRLYYADGCHC